jgi:hypothetical protein
MEPAQCLTRLEVRTRAYDQEVFIECVNTLGENTDPLIASMRIRDPQGKTTTASTSVAGDCPVWTLPIEVSQQLTQALIPLGEQSNVLMTAHDINAASFSQSPSQSVVAIKLVARRVVEG